MRSGLTWSIRQFMRADFGNSRVYPQTRLSKKIRNPRSPFSRIEKRTFVTFFALHCFGEQKTRRRLALSVHGVAADLCND